MDKIKFGLFDVFVYTIPGIIIEFAIYILFANLNSNVEAFIRDTGKIVSELNLNMFILSVFVAYLLGFVLHYFGYRYFAFIASKIWKKRFNDQLKNPLHSERRYVKVRHLSKENFVYVDQWNTYRGMSFNLSLAFLVICIEIPMKLLIVSSFRIDWIIFISVFLVMSIVTLRRAVTFHFWSLSTLSETFEMLEPEERNPAINQHEQINSDQSFEIESK